MSESHMKYGLVSFIDLSHRGFIWQPDIPQKHLCNYADIQQCIYFNNIYLEDTMC